MSLVFTLGYQGRALEELLEIVRSHRVEQVIDVRENAWSRKPGFSAPELEAALAPNGATYSHLPELGCTRAARHALWGTSTTERFFEEYRERLATRTQAVADLLARVRESQSLLLCLERDPSRCHRAVLAERLRAEGFSVVDL